MKTMTNNIFYRIDQSGNAALYDTDTREVVTTLDADVWPVGFLYESARHEHPEGITLTLEDAELLGIPEEESLEESLMSRATDYIVDNRPFSEFVCDIGWADWMEDYTEATHGDDISESEERAINNMLSDIWDNAGYRLRAERDTE